MHLLLHDRRALQGKWIRHRFSLEVYAAINGSKLSSIGRNVDKIISRILFIIY